MTTNVQKVIGLGSIILTFDVKEEGIGNKISDALSGLGPSWPTDCVKFMAKSMDSLDLVRDIFFDEKLGKSISEVETAASISLDLLAIMAASEILKESAKRSGMPKELIYRASSTHDLARDATGAGISFLADASVFVNVESANLSGWKAKVMEAITSGNIPLLGLNMKQEEKEANQ